MSSPSIVFASKGPAFRTLHLLADNSSGSDKYKILQEGDENFSETPYTDYGTFREEDEEDGDIRFFQYGRFFGLSVSLGTEGVTGNRGALWAPGFPMIEGKIHYWFDFNFSLLMVISTVSHSYDYAPRGGHFDVNMVHLGLGLKYAFETRNLPSAISFANPFITGGAGNYSKTEFNSSNQTKDTEGAFGFNGGAGFEFVLKPKRTYFLLEGKVHYVKFKDTNSTAFRQAVPDLTGLFYTVTGGILFSW